MYFCTARQQAEMPAPEERRTIMQSTIEETPVIRKTKELCQAILDEPAMKSIRQRIDTFSGDEKTRAQYEEVVTSGQALQEKQQQSQPLSQEEIGEFERKRDALLGNPVARDFLDAQEELHGLKHTVHQYLNKTLELGRLPTEEDLEGHSCGNHGGDGGCCGGH